MPVFFHQDQGGAGAAKSRIAGGKTAIKADHQEGLLPFGKRDKLLRLREGVGEGFVEKGWDTVLEQQLHGGRMRTRRRMHKGGIERCGCQRLLDARMQMRHPERAAYLSQHVRIARCQVHIQLWKSAHN